jgi:hypothetical protein
MVAEKTAFARVVPGPMEVVSCTGMGELGSFAPPYSHTSIELTLML